MRKRIYLAGPEVFLPEATRRAVFERKLEICAAHGFEGVHPFDAAPPPPAATPREQGLFIAAQNERLIDGCDLLVANMTPFRGPSIDVGTAYEMAYMRGLGRPVLGYTNVADDFETRTRHACGQPTGAPSDARGMQIESFELTDNLMIEGAVVSSAHEVVRHTAATADLFTDQRGFEACIRQAAERRDAMYYTAKRWTAARALSGLRYFSDTAARDWHRAIGLVWRFVEGLYLLRIPLFTLAFLIALPAFAFGPGRALLENLFVDLGLFTIWLTTVITSLTAGTAVAVVNTILVNGSQRFPGVPLGHYYGGPLHWLVLAAPIPIVTAMIREAPASVSPSAGIAAAMLGVAIAWSIFIWIRIEQNATARRIVAEYPHIDWLARYLVYPYRLFDEDVGEGDPSTQPKALRWLLAVLRAPGYSVWRVRSAVVGWLARKTERLGLPALLGRVAHSLIALVPGDGFLFVAPGVRPLIYSAQHALLLLNLALGGLWLLLSYAPLHDTLLIEPLPFLVFSIWLGCALLSVAAFVLDRYRVPLLTLIAAWAFLGGDASNVYETQATERRDDVRPSATALLGDGACEPIVLVAAAGGGIQAAAWTAKVLGELSQRVSGFRGSVVLMSGVSGGSVGVFHVADGYGEADTALAATRAFGDASASSLSDVAWGLVSIDIPKSFVPEPRAFDAFDRGWALERAFDRRARKPGVRLSEWETDAAAGRRPAVLFNATLVESGLPIVFGTTALPDATTGRRYAAVDFRTLKLEDPHYAADTRVATAVRLSATFPAVTPVARASARGEVHLSQHVADGGYYDNFGMLVLLQWLDAGLAETTNTCSTRRVLVIQIRAFPEPPQATRQEPGAFFQLFAPLTTLANVRTAAQRLRNDQLLAYLTRYWATREVSIESLEIDFALPAGYADPDLVTPLSWKLNPRQKAAIVQAWEDRCPDVVASVGTFLEGARQAPAACPALP